MTWTLPIGARWDGEQTHVRVWATSAQRVVVARYDQNHYSDLFELAPQADGYFAGASSALRPGDRYGLRLNGQAPLPDPASRFQPLGVHGPSEVVDPHAFAWTDNGWHGVTLDAMVIYELHVGTATQKGTFEALIPRLADLVTLGVTAIELMPVAAFPGERGWGYDGVDLFAPHVAYGGPEGLRHLVDAAHAHGLAVLLDVVYNHLGPDGNYLRQFSPYYFTHRHKTPWGDAINVDGPHNRPVRDFFIANACYWLHEFHLDGLRLDATHAILDDSPTHLLAELTMCARASLPAERSILLFAEDERNDPRLVLTENGGWGLDGVWADDFHHEMRVALTGEREGYYMDYAGIAEELAATIRQGWFYVGQQSLRHGRGRGFPADELAPPHFIYCIQNHDQVGNRALGERLNHDLAPEAYRAASTLLLLCPQTPLLWMGQEWAASTPFLFFTDHHEELGRLVTLGRRSEFAGFTAFSNETVPDPQVEETFLRSKLNWEERMAAAHEQVLHLYTDLLRLRRELPALCLRDRASFQVEAIGEYALALRRTGGGEVLLALICLRESLCLTLASFEIAQAPAGYVWQVLFDSEQPHYGGQGRNKLSPDGTELVFEEPGAVLLRANLL